MSMKWMGCLNPNIIVYYDIAIVEPATPSILQCCDSSVGHLHTIVFMREIFLFYLPNQIDLACMCEKLDLLGV